MNIKAVNGWILLKEVPKEEHTPILLPSGVSSGKEISSEVMIMTIESIGQDADQFCLRFQEGEKVLVATYVGTSFAYAGEGYKLIQAHDVLAVIE